MAKAKEVDQNKKTWTTNNQVVYNLFMSHCTPEIETKLQGMETWGKIDPKLDGLGMISLICDVTQRCNETEQSMLDIIHSDKDMILCHQKERISLTQYSTDFKARTKVFTVVGGKPGHHLAALKLVNAEQGLEIDILEVE